MTIIKKLSRMLGLEVGSSEMDYYKESLAFLEGGEGFECSIGKIGSDHCREVLLNKLYDCDTVNCLGFSINRNYENSMEVMYGNTYTESTVTIDLTQEVRYTIIRTTKNIREQYLLTDVNGNKICFH
jgi:hypothetical protein